MNLEQLGKKARTIWKKHGRKIAAITVGLVVAIGLYNYYDNHVIKQSPEYMIEQLNTAIQNGDRDTVYKYVNLYNLIDETAKTTSLLNVKVEDWANGADALSESINRDQMVADVAENILNNIKDNHKIMYTGDANNIVSKGIRMLGINDLEFESIHLTKEKSDVPILDLTVHDTNKKDVKYVIHIRLKKVDNRWMLDQLVAADTVIKTRLVDYKQNLTEENRNTIALFNKLIKISNPTVSIQDLAKPELSPKELFKLSKEEKENLFKLKSKLKIEAPILLDTKVDSAKAIVTFTDKNTGTIIKELPIDIAKGSTTISYDKDVNYTDKAQELLADAIKNNRVLVSITIQSVTTSDGTKTLKQ